MEPQVLLELWNHVLVNSVFVKPRNPVLVKPRNPVLVKPRKQVLVKA